MSVSGFKCHVICFFCFLLWIFDVTCFICFGLFIVRTGAEGRWRRDNMQQRATGRLPIPGRCSEDTNSSRFARSTHWATRAALIIILFFSNLKTVFIAEGSCIFCSVLSWCTIWIQQQCYVLSGKPKVRQKFHISYCGSLKKKKKKSFDDTEKVLEQVKANYCLTVFLFIHWDFYFRDIACERLKFFLCLF